MTQIKNLLPLLILIMLSIACASDKLSDRKEKNSKTEKTVNIPADAKLFPPEEVCNYPQAASNKKFSALAGGSWRNLKIEGEDLGWDCGRQTEIQLFKNGSDVVQIEYAVIGVERGARYFAIDYFVSTSTPVANEKAYRREYVQFVSEMTGKALGQPLPDAVIKKITDLKSFAATGVDNSENIEVGSGAINLSRNRNPGNEIIFVKVQIFADKRSVNE